MRPAPGRGIGQPVSDHDHAPFGAESRAESNDLALSGTVGSQQRCSRQRRETTVTPCSRRTAGRSGGVHWRSRSGPGSYPDGWWCRVRAVWTVMTRWTTGVIRRRHSSPCVQHHATASGIQRSGSDLARLARAPCTPDDRPAPSVRKWGLCGRGRHPFPHARCTPPSSPAAVRGDPGPPLVAMRPAPCRRIRDPEERLGPRPQVLVRQRVGDPAARTAANGTSWPPCSELSSCSTTVVERPRRRGRTPGGGGNCREQPSRRRGASRRSGPPRRRSC